MNKLQETAPGFLSDAREFFAAAELVLNKAGEVSLPSYFLLGRSVELSLKAFLLTSGVTREELRSRKYGHDLDALLKEATKRGLEKQIPIKDVERGVIELLNYDYAEKRFEYRISGGTYLLPRIDVTVQITRKLAYGLQEFCSPAA